MWKPPRPSAPSRHRPGLLAEDHMAVPDPGRRPPRGRRPARPSGRRGCVPPAPATELPGGVAPKSTPVHPKAASPRGRRGQPPLTSPCRRRRRPRLPSRRRCPPGWRRRGGRRARRRSRHPPRRPTHPPRLRAPPRRCGSPPRRGGEVDVGGPLPAEDHVRRARAAPAVVAGRRGCDQDVGQPVAVHVACACDRGAGPSPSAAPTMRKPSRPRAPRSALAGVSRPNTT